MAQILVTVLGVEYTVNYPDVVEGSIKDGLAEEYNYPNFVPNPAAVADPTQPPQIPNPQDKLDFVLQKLVTEILNKNRNRVITKAQAAGGKAAGEAYDQMVASVTVGRV